MKRIMLLLAGYALYRWWTRETPQQPEGPPIALPPPRRKPVERRTAN